MTKTKQEWVEHLKQRDVCRPGLAWFLRRRFFSRKQIVKQLCIEDRWTWAGWTLQNILEPENARLFTRFMERHLRENNMFEAYDRISRVDDENLAANIVLPDPKYAAVMERVVDYGIMLIEQEERIESEQARKNYRQDVPKR